MLSDNNGCCLKLLFSKTLKYIELKLYLYKLLLELNKGTDIIFYMPLSGKFFNSPTERYNKFNSIRTYSTSCKDKNYIKHENLTIHSSFSSILSNKSKDPWFVTGFSDGEGCFHVSIIKDKSYKLGFKVILFFEINLSEKDLALLEQIKSFFRIGSINYNKKTKSFMFIVSSSKDLKIIIDHFNQFPLITHKLYDFEFFQQVYNLILSKEHLTENGLRKIVSIKASMNRGLSKELKEAFMDIIPANRERLLVKVDCAAHKKNFWPKSISRIYICWR